MLFYVRNPLRHPIEGNKRELNREFAGTMAAQANLPQMKSIWIDEDQEAEKLYGLQAQHLMDSDDEEQVDVVMINSDRPVLNNKKKIDLPPLIPTAYKRTVKKVTVKSQDQNVLEIKGNKLLKFFKSKQSRQSSKQTKISVPFNFQHISHADVKSMLDDDIPEDNNEIKELDNCNLDKAFVTERLPQISDNRKREKSFSSKSSIERRSISISSSQYSNMSGRIVSTSTMATSVLEEGNRSLSKLNNLEKMHLKHRYNKSESSSISVDFLKNYQFPTVLEDASLLEFKTPDMSKEKIDRFVWESPENTAELLETMIGNDCSKVTKMLSRRKSDSQLIVTPVVDQNSSFLDTPRTRRSVDDVLLCYHQTSETSSHVRGSSEFSFEDNSSTVQHPLSKWDKDTETFMV